MPKKSKILVQIQFLFIHCISNIHVHVIIKALKVSEIPMLLFSPIVKLETNMLYNPE